MRYLSKSVTRVQERRKIIQCEKRTERIGSTRTTGYIVKQQEGISVWYAWPHRDQSTSLMTSYAWTGLGSYLKYNLSIYRSIHGNPSDKRFASDVRFVTTPTQERKEQSHWKSIGTGVSSPTCCYAPIGTWDLDKRSQCSATTTSIKVLVIIIQTCAYKKQSESC